MRSRAVGLPFVARNGALKCARPALRALAHVARSQVAICQRFLHGCCDDAACPLSHEPAAERMPTCRLFLRGTCTDAACPFVHVHLGPAAPPCAAFSRCGYCDAGAACEQRHEQACELPMDGGSCALGDRCKFRRPRRARPPQRPSEPPAATSAHGGGLGGGGEDDEGGDADGGDGNEGGGGGGDFGDLGDDLGGVFRGHEGDGEEDGGLLRWDMRPARGSFSGGVPLLRRDSSICPQLDSPVAAGNARRESESWDWS